MSRLVLDASAAVAVALTQKRGEPLLDLLETATSVLAPDIFASEVANTLWKYASHGELTSDGARQALELTLSLVDELPSTAAIAPEVLFESIRLGHPAYDLCYAVVARRNAATVLTLDSRLAKLLDSLGVPHLP